MNKTVCFLLILISTNSMAQKDFDKKIRSLLSGTIPYIYEGNLKEKISNNEDLIILDTRSLVEYNTSHLKGAKYIDYDNFRAGMVKELDKNKEVVVYCSVGYRSEKIGEKLRDMGFSKVHNLYGGIFEWKNKGNVVVSKLDNVTDSVHTYNKDWSKWLLQGVKVYE